MADGVSSVRYLLANDSGLTAQVPAARIMAGALPQGIALPAVSVMMVSSTRPQHVAGASGMVRERVQVTVIAGTYPSQKAVLALVRAALPRSRGTVNGCAVDSILPDVEGPDFSDPDAGLYIGSLDYVVTYTE